MKIRYTTRTLFIVIVFLSFIFETRCKKDEEKQIQIPELKTSTVIEITRTTATCGGRIISDGGSKVTSCGICWSTITSPTIADNKINNGNGVNSFRNYLTSLTPNTTYYVRAYATNSIGTAYGNEVSFTTNPLTLPVIYTSSISSVTSCSAKSGGNITSDGGSIITNKGICWSSSQNPTIFDNHTTDGIGLGIYYSSLTGLSLGNIYYVRAYATNSIGTAYGNVVSFKTVLSIGENYLGGIIAYFFQAEDVGYIEGEVHGLIAAPYDQSDGIKWDEFLNGVRHYTDTKVTIGSGLSNTILIVNTLGNGNYAAKMCYDLDLGGYSDWFLPSRDELNILYINRLSIGNLSSGYYWCSTSNDALSTGAAWGQNFVNGDQSDRYSKENLFHVRAVRNF